MTEPYGDPVNQPYWAACQQRRLTVQRCEDCGHHQHYGRPYCLRCQSDRVAWVEAAGTGTIYSATEVHLEVNPALTPPYWVAVVELDEGPRLTTNVVGGAAAIGARVRVAWRDREDLPPLPIFELAEH